MNIFYSEYFEKRLPLVSEASFCEGKKFIGVYSGTVISVDVVKRTLFAIGVRGRTSTNRYDVN